VPATTATPEETPVPVQTVIAATVFPRRSTVPAEATGHPGTPFPERTAVVTPDSQESDEDEGGSTGLLVGSIILLVVLVGLYVYVVFKEKQRKDENRTRAQAKADKEAGEADAGHYPDMKSPQYDGGVANPPLDGGANPPLDGVASAHSNGVASPHSAGIDAPSFNAVETPPYSGMTNPQYGGNQAPWGF
jgi:hypothetical protein